MSRRRYGFDEEKVRKYEQEGRGQGFGADYRPWLTIYDVPSRGRSHRPFGIKTQRVHHLLSDGEWKAFLQFEADPQVLDIREQVPLDRWETFRIAHDLAFRPAVTTDGTPYVLTLDFLVTRRIDDGIRLEAYSVKYQRHTLDERDWQLHRIAEEFVRRQGVALELLDETCFNDYFTRNYDTVRACFDITADSRYDPIVFGRVATALVNVVIDNTSGTLGSVCHDVARAQGARADIVFLIAKHLLAHRFLVADLAQASDLTLLRAQDLRIVKALPNGHH